MNEENILIKTLIIYYSDFIQYTKNYLIDNILKNGSTKIRLHVQVLINEYQYNNPQDKKIYEVNDVANILKYFFGKKGIAIEYAFLDEDLLLNLL